MQDHCTTYAKGVNPNVFYDYFCVSCIQNERDLTLIEKTLCSDILMNNYIFVLQSQSSNVVSLELSVDYFKNAN